MSRRQPLNSSSAVLWASAFVIGALTIVQAGRLPGNAAHAEAADQALIDNSGVGGDADPDELLYVIDNTDQVLMVYEVEDARRGKITLRDGGSLDNLFRAARR